MLGIFNHGKQKRVLIECHDPLSVGATLAKKEFTNLQPDLVMVNATFEEKKKILYLVLLKLQHGKLLRRKFFSINVTVT